MSVLTISHPFRINSLALILLISIGVYFGYHLIYGERSITRYFELKSEEQQAISELKKLQEKRLKRQVQVERLRPDSLNPDYALEQMRIMLGVRDPDEIDVLIE